MPADTCTIVDCDRRRRARGWCISHYNRWRLNGTPGPATFAPSADLTHGAEHPNWRGTAIGYRGAHNRVTRLKGKASAHPCVECSGEARTWAYDGADAKKIDAQGRRYSADPAHYLAMCAACHCRRDGYGFRSKQVSS